MFVGRCKLFLVDNPRYLDIGNLRGGVDVSSCENRLIELIVVTTIDFVVSCSASFSYLEFIFIVTSEGQSYEKGWDVWRYLFRS